MTSLVMFKMPLGVDSCSILMLGLNRDEEVSIMRKPIASKREQTTVIGVQADNHIRNEL